MAIGLLCPKCWKSTPNLTSKKCKCGYARNKRKFKVRVKNTSGGWRTGTADTLTAAKLLEIELMKNNDDTASEGKVPPPICDIPTIADIWPLYLEWATINKKSWDMDKSRYKNFIQKPLSHFPMDIVKPFHVQKILNKMNLRYKPASIKQVLMLIKRIYSWSKEQTLYTGSNPCDPILIPHFDNRVMQPLNKDEIHRLNSVLDTWPNKIPVLIIKFALYSGKRKAEILGLRWSDVNLENGFMTLHNTKNGSTQSLPLNKHCLGILHKAKEIRTSIYVFPLQGEPSPDHEYGNLTFGRGFLQTGKNDQRGINL